MAQYLVQKAKLDLLITEIEEYRLNLEETTA